MKIINNNYNIYIMIIIISSITGSLCVIGAESYLVKTFKKWKKKKNIARETEIGIKCRRLKDGKTYNSTLTDEKLHRINENIKPNSEIEKIYQDEDKLCMICLDNESNVIYDMYQHKVSCQKCAKEYENFIYAQNKSHGTQKIPECIYCSKPYSEFIVI